MAEQRSCRDCGDAFWFSASEATRFTRRGLQPPGRCPRCRRIRRLRRLEQLRDVAGNLHELSDFLRRGDVSQARAFLEEWQDGLVRAAQRVTNQEQEHGAHEVSRTA